MTTRLQWNGGEWQEHCIRLLGMKHGVDVQFVPDRVRGDGGMEAYRLDDGVVYQCYAPEEAFTVSAQLDAHKRKIRDDIAKLVKNRDETMKILGEQYRIRRWVLLTPEYDDKEVVKYARSKSQRTRALSPPPVWCHDDFQIVVSTDRELFAAELSAVDGMTVGSIRLVVKEPEPEDAADLAGEGIAEKLRGKLRVNPGLSADAMLLEQFCTDTLLDYVYGKRQLQVLEDRYGLAFDSVRRRAQSTFRTLTRKLAAGDVGPTDLEHLAVQLAAGFRADVPGLAPIACEDLSRHYVASWLIECPLRFRAAS